jgi:hypothetical protein
MGANLIPIRVDGSVENKWTNVPAYAPFLAPYNEPYTPHSQNILGGTALNRGNEGRMVKIWNISYENEIIKIKPSDGDVVWQRGEPGIKSLSCAFDNNMSQVIGWRKDTGCALYYYDTTIQQFRVRDFPDATACRVCVDDPRDFYNAQSDVMFIYTSGNRLYYRQQRDRYDIEYFIGNTTKILKRAGPNVGYRLQIELV